MRLLPTHRTQLDPNIQWLLATHLDILEEVAREPRGAGTGDPSPQVANRRIGVALVRQDWEAEEAAIDDFLRGQFRAWLRDFPEGPLFTRLLERAARWRSRSGTRDRDRSRRPTHPEGLRIARALLEGVTPPGPLDTEGEAATLAAMLAGYEGLTYAFPPRARWREYVRLSRRSRVHFDALGDLIAEWERQGRPIPRGLARWRQKVAEGRRRRPDSPPIPRHRPANPAQMAYEMEVQGTIEILHRLRVPPRGTFLSGCRMVAEALDIPEDTVVRIWKKCPWRTSFLPTMGKYSRAIAIRHGLYPPN